MDGNFAGHSTNSFNMDNIIVSAPAALRIKDACKFAGVSRAKLYRLMAAGKIPAFRSGGNTFIRPDVIKNYLDSCPPWQPITPA